MMKYTYVISIQFRICEIRVIFNVTGEPCPSLKLYIFIVKLLEYFLMIKKEKTELINKFVPACCEQYIL